MKFLPTLLLLASIGGVASAATLVQTQTFAFTPAASQNLVFSKFDTLGGTRTLQSVTITTSVTKSGGALYVDNDSNVEASGSISQSVTITLSGNVPLVDGNFLTIGAASVTATSFYSVILTANDGDGINYQEGGSDWGGTTFGDITASKTSDIGPINAYSGTGTYTMTATGAQATDTSSLSGVSGAFTSASASGFVTITYTYVPEPASTMLGGLGVIMLLTRHRRR